MKRKNLFLVAGRMLGLALGGALLMSSTLMGDGGSRWWQWRDANIVERLERDGRFTTLLTALELTELKEVVAENGPLTLIAPTDDAFATVPTETLEALIADPEALKQVLLYHVVGDRASAYHLFRDTTPVTLDGNPLLVTLEQRKLAVNGIRITQANIWASNGVIHVIEDGVLLPPAEPILIHSVVDILKLDGRFNTLLTAVAAAGLEEALATSPSLTLLAPTDEAFAKIPADTLEAVLADQETLTEILLYHVVGEKKGIFRMLREQSSETLQGQTVETSYNARTIRINDSVVLNPDVSAPNGIIHVIDSVLLPEDESATPDLVDLLAADGRFNTLIAAVQAAGLEEVLRGEGPFTVLAPTDEAFARLPEGTVDALLADPATLQQVLLYHVISGEISLADLRSERSAETVQGSDVNIHTWWRWTRINQAWVIDADLHAANGVAHVIHSVLIPPSE